MSADLTPMMRQYQGARRSLPPNTLLLFRLGDFYEMFFEDAVEAAGLLNVALTKRNGVPMCGVPFHAADGYIARLVRAGKRVAICDQVSEPIPGKIVERQVTQIVSPGTVADTNLLEDKRNNYLAAICGEDGRFGLAYVDTSTGDFRITELENEAGLRDELARVAPAEVVVPDDPAAALPDIGPVTQCDGYAFLYEHAHHALREHLRVQALDGFGCEGMNLAVRAAGAALHYLKHQLRRNVSHVARLTAYQRGSFMVLDEATQRNLELVQSRNSRNTSLLAALDRTATPMGGRVLRDWILRPLCEVAPLVDRQNAIAALIAVPHLLADCRENLRSVRDIERIVGRLNQAGGNARDLAALATSLSQIPAVRKLLAHVGASAGSDGSMPGMVPPGTLNGLLGHLASNLVEFPDLVDLLARALVDEPPAQTKDGGIFRDGYDPGLDELRGACRGGKEWVAALQQREIERTGIKSLKVRYTSVFGYFLEITKSNLGNVPADYIRKQTTVGGERFITPELKEMEAKILGADERARALEYELFVSLRARILERLDEIQRSASALGTLDVLCSLAEIARQHNYCRPELNDGSTIRLRESRHPVLDQQQLDERFVPNDCLLDDSDNRLLIITGPNMAGKSTYIRQVALLVLMAQIGSFLPATEAEVGLVDRIFTRVGASDDISRGQSTFMVEMHETANIANNATDRSLVILDEIGRGTSTFDGLSIAWSVAEYLHDILRARTLFATHYHELTELELTRTGAKNFNVAVREWSDQVIFLRKIVRGGADKSYGIQVARLAGLPAAVIGRAKEILANLEKSELNADGKPKLAEHLPSAPARARKRGKVRENAGGPDRPQLSLFG